MIQINQNNTSATTKLYLDYRNYILKSINQIISSATQFFQQETFPSQANSFSKISPSQNQFFSKHILKHISTIQSDNKRLTYRQTYQNHTHLTQIQGKAKHVRFELTRNKSQKNR